MAKVRSGPLMVGRTTAQYMQAGVAALHIEDQVQTKRCGHLKNKELVDEDVYVARIRAAANMRAASAGDIVIIARTDALASLGYDAAVSRLKAAIAAGADVAFLEAITSEEQARRVCQELSPTPVLLNMVAGGMTANISVQKAKEIGFKIIIYPILSMGPMYKAVKDAAKELKETGIVERSPGADVSAKQLFELCGLNEAVEFDIAAGGSLYAKGV
jgi:2-methylisocitrate lyase-like PEP mutase family enzyme